MLPFDTIKKNLIKYKNNNEDDKYRYQIIHFHYLLQKKKFENKPEILDFITNLFDEHLISELDKNNLVKQYKETTKI